MDKLLMCVIILYHTKIRPILYTGEIVDEVVRLLSSEDAGLNEAQERVELLQVVLDGCPRQQDPEPH